MVWHITPLPLEKGAFGVGHHGEVATIGGAKASNTVWRTIWVKGVGFGRGIIVIDIAHGAEIFAYDAVEYVCAGKKCAAFAVRDPHAERCASHVFEHNCWTVLNLHSGKAGFKTRGFVANKPGLCRIGKAGERNPAEQGHELAAIAYAEAEGIGAVVEGIKLGAKAIVEANHTSPAFGRVEHSSIKAVWT